MLPKTSHLAALWPGLPELWRTGDSMALSWATIFSILLNLCIVTTWIWTEVLTGFVWGVIWVGTAAFWLVGCYKNARFLQNLAYISARAASPDLFADAQLQYLLGNWYECEQIIQQLLERRSNDVEAHVLWIAVLRQTEHLEQALALIEQTQLLAGSERWYLELARERQQLQAMLQADVGTVDLVAA